MLPRTIPPHAYFCSSLEANTSSLFSSDNNIEYDDAATWVKVPRPSFGRYDISIVTFQAVCFAILTHSTPPKFHLCSQDFLVSLELHILIISLLLDLILGRNFSVNYLRIYLIKSKSNRTKLIFLIDDISLQEKKKSLEFLTHGLLKPTRVTHSPETKENLLTKCA